MAQNADLDIVLSTLHITPNNSIRPSFANFSLPSARHGCAGGTRLRTCPSCAGSGASRSGNGGKTLTQCTTCTGKGFQTSSCAICLSSLKSAHEYQKAKLEIASCDRRGSCTAASTDRGSETTGNVKPRSQGVGEALHEDVDKGASGGRSDDVDEGKGGESAGGEEDGDVEAEERADTPVR